MKIVVLDGYALNPGDLSWEGFGKFGVVIVYERTPAEETLARAKDAEIVITNKTVLSKGIIENLPKLRYIGVLATGYNVVDTAAARERGIPVTNIPAYGTDSVAQHAFALLLELTNRVGLHADMVADGAWCKSKDFCFWQGTITELAGKTMGIIGAGRIGRRMARIAEAFGMNVRLYGPHLENGETVESILEKSDVISLHCPLTAGNARMMNAAAFARMKKGALLINTARGGLVDEQALVDALASRQLGGAALDVVDAEPMAADSPLLKAKNLIVTPHVAWVSIEARRRLMQTAVANVQAFVEGKPQNVVNG